MRSIWTLTTRFGLFAAVMIGLLGISYLLNNWMYAQLDYAIPGKVKTLIIGDSRPNTGLNEAWIDSTLNISIRGEATFTTYIKLKAFIEKSSTGKHHIKNIVCGFSYHNLSGVNDRWMKERSMANNYFEKYIWITPQTFLDRMDYDKRAYRVQFFKNKILPNLQIFNYNFLSNRSQPSYYKLAYNGRFRLTYESLLEQKDLKKQMKKLFGPPKDVQAPSAICIQYLDSIINFCKMQDFDLYIIHLPYHPNFYKNVPQNIKQVYNQTLEKAVAQTHVRFLDYSTEQIPLDNFFDFGHLNSRGAELYSARIDSLLNRH